METIEDAGEREALRRQARGVLLRSLGATLLFTAAALLLPPLG